MSILKTRGDSHEKEQVDKDILHFNYLVASCFCTGPVEKITRPNANSF